ncbi:MAG: hypothetical protein ALECFALPRED_001987 [Alectoria fallacina]|uniref:Uncharacterized protein n=1 Tax=Alectoria fallacina TaxID=1903189 RepID=A0A8H3FCN1_9LECA|nr:MAG: hypothetical protein ALECFALPRED_001987 [Alectoria fallacina]
MSSSFLSSHPDFTSPPSLGPLTLHPSFNGSFANNPIEQFHFRTIQRIVKEHPEFTETYQPPVPSFAPGLALKYNLRITPSHPPCKMSGKQTMTWNGEADAKLLLAILKVSDVKPDFEALTTDDVTCTPRAVQEHLKKLRKVAQAEADPTAPGKSTITTPVKAARKAAATPNGVKKTRKPATAGKGKKGKAAANVDDAEGAPIKMETGCDNDNDAPTFKKRKYKDFGDVSSDVGEGSLIGSELADLAQAGLDDEVTA